MSSLMITTALSLSRAIIARKESQPVDLSTRQMNALAEGFMELYQLRTSDTNTSPDPHDATPATPSKANSHQIAGAHYGLSAFQHWDMVVMFKLDYFQGQITKYVMRWRQKNGVQDLQKAAHFLEKYIETAAGTLENTE